MAVVINEFEVMPATASATQPPANPPGQGEAGAMAPTPAEIAKLLQHLRERALRVWAH